VGEVGFGGGVGVDEGGEREEVGEDFGEEGEVGLVVAFVLQLLQSLEIRWGNILCHQFAFS